MSHDPPTRPHIPRSFSSQLHHYRLSPAVNNYGTISENDHEQPRPNAELEHLLEEQDDEDQDHADSDGLYPPNCCWTADTTRPARADIYGHSKWPVYDNIHSVRREIIHSIDDPYSLDQLKTPRMNLSVVRPLVNKFYNLQDLSIIYCLLANRTQFIREQSYATHHQSVNLTRALLCEIVAEKILRRYNEHNPGPKGLLKLANILVAGFEPFQNAPEDVIKNSSHVLHYVRNKGGKHERSMTALEVAIVSESKSFLASSACQKVVDAIYRGKIVYTPNSFVDILPDYWKKRPISLYDPRRGPLLNQYRLAVPRTRNIIEILQFVVLLVLYLTVMEGRETRATVEYTILEAVFDFYAWGWILDQVASMLEHGWSVYTQNLWVFLDVMFCCLFSFYFWVRMFAFSRNDPDDMQEWARLALDALSCAAPLLIPRLAFNMFSENLVFLCLRDMLANFVMLVLFASWCFIGFLLSLKWLHNGLHEPTTIAKWMISIFFGLDSEGLDEAPGFHWLLGPTIMVMFAFLGNTLFVTILVSVLNNTFSNISANAVQEMQFRRSVLTFEGVKADALFAYMPPMNLLAVLFILPAKFVLTPRWFHKVNVFTVKTLNAPFLVLICLYERRTLWVSSKYRKSKPRGIDWRNPDGPHPRGIGWWSRTFQYWDLSRFSVHGDMQAVFDEVSAQTIGGDGQDESIGHKLNQSLMNQFDTKTKSIANSQEKLKRITTSSSGAMKFKQEFDTDSDDGNDEHHNGTGAPKGYERLPRGKRKDSIIDFHETDLSMTEANARLQKLEESMASIQNLLMVLVNSDEPDDELVEADTALPKTT